MMAMIFSNSKNCNMLRVAMCFLLGAKMSCFCCVFWGQTSHFVWFLVNSLDSADGIARLCPSKLPFFRVLVYFLVGILILSWFEFFKSTVLKCFSPWVLGFCSPFLKVTVSALFFLFVLGWSQPIFVHRAQKLLKRKDCVSGKQCLLRFRFVICHQFCSKQYELIQPFQTKASRMCHHWIISSFVESSNISISALTGWRWWGCGRWWGSAEGKMFLPSFSPDAQQHFFCLNSTCNGHNHANSVYAFFDV